MWSNYNHKDFGIIGEPCLSIDYNEVLYLINTGRTWNGEKVSVKDVVNSLNVSKVSSIQGVIDLLCSEQYKHIGLLAHPNKWCDNFGSWLWELVWLNTKNVRKRGIFRYRESKKQHHTDMSKEAVYDN